MPGIDFVSKSHEQYKNSVLLIQKKFLFKRLIRSIKSNESLICLLCSFTEDSKNSNLFDQSAEEDKRFFQLQNLLTSSENIKKFSDILDKVYRYKKIDNEVSPRISAKKFMSAWMLVSFPNVIIGKSKSNIINELEYPDDIYFISKKMIEALFVLIYSEYNMESRRIFFKAFNQYSNAINYFLNRDKLEKVFQLTKEYFDICKTLKLVKMSKKYSEDAQKECIKVIDESKNKLIQYIKIFDSSINKEDLELYADLENFKSKKMEECQYKILVNDIKSRKFVFFKQILTEITTNLKKLSGSSRTCDDIDDVLDSEFLIKSMIYSLEKDDITRYGNYLINIINKLQAPIRVQETKNAWIIMTNKTFDTDEYLASMLVLIFDEIRDIKETIVNLATMSSVGINIFTV